MAAETWGVPPWVIEENASLDWMYAFARYEQDKAKQRERAARKLQKR